MTTEKTSTTASTNGSDDDRGAIVGVMSSAQGAAQATAGAVRNVAETAAERLPGAVSTAQEVAAGTATTLDELPDQALMIGTSFSLGLGIGLFLTGAHRLFVILALVPAAAMAATLMNRPNVAEKATQAVRKRTQTTEA
jgi:hypothetical protein